MNFCPGWRRSCRTILSFSCSFRSSAGTTCAEIVSITAASTERTSLKGRWYLFTSQQCRNSHSRNFVPGARVKVKSPRSSKSNPALVTLGQLDFSTRMFTGLMISGVPVPASRFLRNAFIFDCSQHFDWGILDSSLLCSKYDSIFPVENVVSYMFCLCRNVKFNVRTQCPRRIRRWEKPFPTSQPFFSA